MECGAGNFQLQLPPNVRLQGFKGGKGGNATFSPFKSLWAEQSDASKRDESSGPLARKKN